MSQGSRLSIAAGIVTVLGALSCAALYAVAGQPSSSQPVDLPKALLALEAYREAHLKKGYVQWTMRDERKGSVSHSTSRFAKDDQIYVWRGDDLGVVGQHQDTGEPIVGEFRQLLRQNGEHWWGDHHSVEFRLEPAGARNVPFQDIRAIDLGLKHAPDLHSAIWESAIAYGVPMRFEEKKENELYHVHAVQKLRPREIVHDWWLDPARGWAPVRMQTLWDGQVVSETRSTYRKHDDVWFPQTVLQFDGPATDGRKPVRISTVDSALFGGNLPDQLGPADIGVEAGSMVYITEPFQAKRRNGTRLLSMQEFEEENRSGKIKFGPNLLRSHEEFARHSAEAASRPAATPIEELVLQIRYHDWEQYVKLFIERHALDDSQRTSANAVLRDCKRRARGYVQSRRAEFQKLRDEETQEPAWINGAQRLTIHVNRWKELEKPIDDIFQNELRPRLEGLLTSRQVGAAIP